MISTRNCAAVIDRLRRSWIPRRAQARLARRAFLGGLLASLIAIPVSPSIAAESKNPLNEIPQRFRVEELNINLSRQQGNAAYSPWQIQLSGKDGGSLSHDGKQWPFPYAAGDAVALLNALYEIHFFDLPSQYATHPVAQLNADGTVSLAQMRTSSVSNSVCVAVATFEKCVRYGNQAPPELDRIVQRVFADAQRRAGDT